MQQQQQQQDLHSPGGHQNGGVAQSPVAPNSPGATQQHHPAAARTQISGGRFDFEDGGTYCGGWEEGKAHGHGVCTGPKHQGAYSGAWNYGFEVSGVYIWPSGSAFEGQWQNGRRHGLGVETRGRWIYRGEWTSGSKGRYGVRQSATSTARYEGTWAGGLQDGYGSETYADGGSYQGQWQEGKRHGYGVRTSAPFGLASHYKPKNVHTSMTSLRSNEGGNPDPAEKRNHRMDDVRGGFVLKAKSDEPPARRNSLVEKTKKGLLSGLKLKKQRSTGDLEKRGTGPSGSIRSTVSTASWISTGSSQSNMTNKSMHSDSNASFTVEEEQLDPSVTEMYMGEWKRDKRDGYGVSERTDGLKYEGEWHNNKKHGYGVTTFRDGTKEEGKYKNNVLITSQKKKHLFLIRSAKFRERIEAAVSSSQVASKYALQKADIAKSRTGTARGKAESADHIGELARVDSEVAVATAREFAPDFKPTVLERFERIRLRFRPPLEPADTATMTPNAKLGSVANSPSHQQDNRANQISIDKQSQLQKQQAFAQQSIRRSSLHPPKPTTSTDYSTTANSISHQHDTEPNYSSSSAPMNQQQHPSYQYSQQQPPGSMYGTPQNYPNPNLNQPASPQQSNQMYNSSYNNQTQQMPGNYQQQSYQQQQQQGQSTYSQFTGELASQLETLHNNQQQQQIYGKTPETLQHSSTLRRNSRPVNETQRPPKLGNTSQSSIDHFDHYKRPPSRDSSVDRYARATSRLGGGIGSRQPSVDRQMGPPPMATNTTTDTPDRNMRAGSAFRQTTPAPTTGNGSLPTGTGRSISRAGTPSYQVPQQAQGVYSSPNQPFEDVLLRQRNLGQDIIPSPLQPKRTESLYLPPKPLGGGGGGGGGGKPKVAKSVPAPLPLQRKKSLPDVQELPRAIGPMSREEVSALGSARREEVRRQIENSERLKANPLLYLVSPQVKDWFSRQQLVMLVMLVNILLIIVFIKMLT